MRITIHVGIFTVTIIVKNARTATLHGDGS